MRKSNHFSELLSLEPRNVPSATLNTPIYPHRLGWELLCFKTNPRMRKRSGNGIILTIISMPLSFLFCLNYFPPPYPVHRRCFSWSWCLSGRSWCTIRTPLLNVLVPSSDTSYVRSGISTWGVCCVLSLSTSSPAVCVRPPLLLFKSNGTVPNVHQQL